MATIAIIGGTLIDGTGADPVANTTLIIENGTIITIGPAAQTRVPQGATIIDATSMTIMPGMIDCHVHLLAPGGDLNLINALLTPPSLSVLYAVPNCKATIEAGFTTVRDAGGTPAGVKMAVDRKFFPGPRILVSVTVLSQSGGHGDGMLP